MSRKQTVRMTVDFFMTVILLLLMGYSRVGETAHEWLGITMTILFVIHHILNRKWIAGMFRGKYTPYRILQTILVILIFCTMIGSAVSGIILSKHVFKFLHLGGASAARTVHMLCGYWNFVLMSLHLGLHWSMIIGMMTKKSKKNVPAFTWILRITAFLIVAYGVYALIEHQIPEYLFGITKFAFFDTSQSIVLFLLDYISVMGLFVFIGYYVSKWLKEVKRTSNPNTTILK